MLYRYRQFPVQHRLLVVLAFCLLALQFARFNHSHTVNAGHPVQDCHVCSQIARIGHAPPTATIAVPPPALAAVAPQNPLPVFYTTESQSTAQARAPPVYS